MNLRKWRRAREKAEAEAQAAANRTGFGRTKAEKARDTAEEEQRKALLDAALLDAARLTPPEKPGS